MPAVKYDYDNYNQYAKSSKGVANSARSYQSFSNTGVKRTGTPESTRNSTRAATRAVASNSNRSSSAKRGKMGNEMSNKANNARHYKNASNGRSNGSTKAVSRKRVNADIDIPVIVKKKVNIQKPAEMKLTKPKIKVKANTEGVKRKILLGVAVVSLLFMICFRYTQINEKFNEVGSLEKELASTEALNQQLTSTIESKTDLNYIEKYAKYQLGMQKPTESQIVRIAYEKQDKISTPVVIKEEEEDSFLKKLFNDLKNLID